MVIGLAAAPQMAQGGGQTSSPSKTEKTQKTDTKSEETANTYGGSRTGDDWLNATHNGIVYNSYLGSEMVAFGDYLFVTSPGQDRIYAFLVD